jgi:hypothetical protein
MPYGRQLRGLGADSSEAPFHDSWAGGDAAAIRASEADDTVGNGIFDGEGAPPVQHAGNGVFEAKYSEPGYLYRERLGRPSEVLDQTTGEPIIYHPNAGGAWHEDVLRTYRKWDVETPRYYTSKPRSGGLGQAEGETQKYAPYAVGGLLLGIAAAIAYKQFKR